MGSDLFDAVRTWMRRQYPVTTMIGMIVEIKGVVARVRIAGSKQPVEAMIGPYIGAVAGDRCVLHRSEEENVWIVGTVYSSRPERLSSAAALVAPHVQGAINAKNIGYYDSATTTFNANNTTMTDAFEFTFRTRTESVLVGFNGDALFTASATANVTLDMQIAIDDSVWLPGFVHSVRARATNTFVPISFVIPLKNIKPAEHTFTLQMAQSSTANSALFATRVQKFWVSDN